MTQEKLRESQKEREIERERETGRQRERELMSSTEQRKRDDQDERRMSMNQQIHFRGRMKAWRDERLTDDVVKGRSCQLWSSNCPKTLSLIHSHALESGDGQTTDVFEEVRWRLRNRLT